MIEVSTDDRVAGEDEVADRSLEFPDTPAYDASAQHSAGQGRMRELRKHEKAAIEAVARHFSATWEKGENPPDAYLIIARKRIAVEITALKQPIAGLTKPRLRFDRVALGLMRRLQAALSESVPAGRALIVTVTAPIWPPSKTAAALAADVPRRLAAP